MGQYNEAKNSYLMAISLKKDDAITHYNIANLYRKIGNYDLAIKHYQFVIKLTEEKNIDIGSLYIDYMINIGICFKNLGFYEDAITLYEKVNYI
jgi:tetratricopeptide (TPR) repeat protein